MTDIFENPVKRLYRQKGDDTEADDASGALASLCSEASPEKIKIFVDAFQKLCT